MIKKLLDRYILYIQKHIPTLTSRSQPSLKKISSKDVLFLITQPDSCARVIWTTSATFWTVSFWLLTVVRNQDMNILYIFYVTHVFTVFRGQTRPSVERHPLPLPLFSNKSCHFSPVAILGAAVLGGRLYLPNLAESLPIITPFSLSNVFYYSIITPLLSVKIYIF